MTIVVRRRKEPGPGLTGFPYYVMNRETGNEMAWFNDLERAKEFAREMVRLTAKRGKR